MALAVAFPEGVPIGISFSEALARHADLLQQMEDNTALIPVQVTRENIAELLHLRYGRISEWAPMQTIWVQSSTYRTTKALLEASRESLIQEATDVLRRARIIRTQSVFSSTELIREGIRKYQEKKKTMTAERAAAAAELEFEALCQSLRVKLEFPKEGMPSERVYRAYNLLHGRPWLPRGMHDQCLNASTVLHQMGEDDIAEIYEEVLGM